ncbi:MAG: sulfatase [Verrucomicrobiae bacterium]|nr:sulfatase [Verrucomicrobiae bacterium]
MKRIIAPVLMGLAMADPAGDAVAATRPPNIILILSDDHRYDFMSHMPGAPKWLETPNLDRMAREGARFANAFVSTSLCSPSRASILTGLYMHHHRVVDNQRPVPEGLTFFTQHLQKAGYRTAYFGKWHMGEDTDQVQRGFDHWASFKGQGEYFDPIININGQRKKFEGYTADVLTDLALEWLGTQGDQPFYLQLGHKSPHFPFQPAKRHAGRYAQKPVPRPEPMADTESNYETQPRWMRERRYSIHGVDHMETTPFDNDPVPDFDTFFRNYCETVHSLDENIGRVLAWLEKSGRAKDTVLFYMADNGFELGEHGFYDKRDASEESIRVPLLVWAPGRVKAGTVIKQMVQNIDFAPSVLDATGVQAPADAKMDGRSFWPLLTGRSAPWRDHILYEYYWEWNFPATPTTFAIRTDRYKYIFFHGIWDKDAFYDLQTDPREKHNLIHVPAYQEQIAKLRKQLFDELETSGGLEMPIRPPAGERLGERKLRR